MAESPRSDETGGNAPIYSVGEVSQALKRTVEDGFGWVRIRGEISGFKRAASGHLYFSLKDDKAVLDAVCWRGTVGRIRLAPEDGMEVIASGGLTTFSGRSRYQIVVQQLELAGEGALLKLLEDRKRKLGAEGLFDAERKRELPYLPQVIGVVTSPGGAVIRDILHRLGDRFPTHVIVWPVLVQGDGAAGQIAAAIDGFNALDAVGDISRPDLLIVARGGGSLEDLWAFNEEVVVRAAAESGIPLISAVGHETDVTLIDYVSDQRAPTPSAAAEIAVPVRVDLIEAVANYGRRLSTAVRREVVQKKTQLAGLARGLPDARSLLSSAVQMLDDRIERLSMAWRLVLRERRQVLDGKTPAHPRQIIRVKAERLQERENRLGRQHPRAAIDELSVVLEGHGERVRRAWWFRLESRKSDANQARRLLESLSYKGALARGFAVVRDQKRKPLSAAGSVEQGAALILEFHDGEVAANASGTPNAKTAPLAKSKNFPPSDDGQGTLL